MSISVKHVVLFAYHRAYHVHHVPSDFTCIYNSEVEYICYFTNRPVLDQHSYCNLSMFREPKRMNFLCTGPQVKPGMLNTVYSKRQSLLLRFITAGFILVVSNGLSIPLWKKLVGSDKDLIGKESCIESADVLH